MTLRLVVSCDGTWPGSPPMSCRANLPLKIRDTAQAEAEAAGWTLTAATDLCPACSRAAKETTAIPVRDDTARVTYSPSKGVLPPGRTR